MDLVATAGSVTRATKGRKGRSATVQGAGEEICDVEVERHVGIGEDMEDGSYRRGEEAI